MSDRLKKNLLKYGISFAICLLLAYVYVALRVDFSLPKKIPLIRWYLILCDAFTVPGLLFLMFGFYVSLSNEGALDGIGYAAVTGLKALIPGAAAKMERYADYLERRRGKRLRGYGFLYVVGLVCMAVAGVFLVLFYSLYQP